MANTASNRAGRYISQPSGYRAFIPEPLPPTNPPIEITEELSSLLAEADRALGRLDGSIQTLPNPDLFLFMYVRKEAVLSSQIEGTQSSLQDVLAAEADIFSPRQPKDTEEVINYVRAMNYGLERLESLPVSLRLIKEIHGVLMEGARGSHLTPGEFRTSPNWIGPEGSTIENATFVPPPPHELQVLLSQWERFIHSDSNLPLLIRVGLAHAQFETLHPFLDGNGRVGRLLIAFLLVQQGVLSKPALYLSHYLKQNRQAYYDKLQATRDAGDWESWLMFFLRGVKVVSEQATETSRRIIELRESHHRKIADNFGATAGNGYRLLEYLYEHPIVSVKDIRGLTGTQFPAANNLATRMVDLGILRELTGGERNRRYEHHSYLDLFYEE